MTNHMTNSLARQGYKSLSCLILGLMAMGLSACGADSSDIAKSTEKAGLTETHSDAVGDRFDHLQNKPSRENKQFSIFLKGALARDADHPNQAASYFGEALEQKPDSLFFKRNSFGQHVMAGQFDKASGLAAELSKHTDDDVTHLIAITAALKEGKIAAALGLLKTAPKSNFNFIIHPVLTGWAHALEQDKQACYKAMDAMAQNPQLALFAYEFKAYMADYLGDAAVADENYRLVVSNKQSASIQAVVGYASFLSRQSRPDAVKALLLENLKRFPRDPFLKRSVKKYKPGQMLRERYMKPLGNIENLFEILARDLADRYKILSLHYYTMASFMQGDRPDLVMQQANMLMEMEKFSLAADRFSRVAPVGYYKRMAQMGQIRANLSAERYSEAFRLMKAIERTEPENPAILTMLADYYRTQEDFAQSLVYLKKLVALNDNPTERDWYNYFAIGVNYEELGQDQLAEQNLLFALDLSPDQPDLLNYLGYSWVDRGVNQARAKAMIEKAAKLSPDSGYIMDSLGWVYYLTGEYGKAVAALEKAVLIEPGDAVLHGHLGDAYWQVGRKREARFQWQHALASDPETDTVPALKAKLAKGL